MSNLTISVPDLAELKPRITVFGVGGGGCNAVNNMIESNLSGVEFVVANTDAQALAKSPCERKIQMGNALTQGLGAGSQPEVGAGAAEEALAEIVDHLAGSHMTFITAGMGGGTGTGAAPVIARAAKEQGVLTVGVVTKPFNFEGKRRMMIAEQGIENLSQFVDTLIVIPNQNLFRVANDKTSFTAAFAMADQVLYSGVASITELMTEEGLINLDFADVKAIMADMGKAMMGTGEASGEVRAVEAAEAAISNPLLDDVSLTGARGVLVSIAGGPDLTLFEVDEAANAIRKQVDDEANIIVGATIKEELEGTMRVSVVATGLRTEAGAERPPRTQEPQTHVYGLGGVGAGIQPGYEMAGKESSGVQEAAGEYEEVQQAPATATATSATETPAAPAAPAEAQAEPRLPLEGAQEQAEQAGQPEQPQTATAEGPAPQEPPLTAQPHTPAPEAARIPPLEEFPEPIRRTAEEKAAQIGAIAAKKSPRRSLLDRLKTFGRHGKEEAPAHDGAHEPRIAERQPTPQAQDNVHRLEERQSTAASSAPAEQAAQEGYDDPFAIPAFLRRQQS